MGFDNPLHSSAFVKYMTNQQTSNNETSLVSLHVVYRMVSAQAITVKHQNSQPKKNIV